MSYSSGDEDSVSVSSDSCSSDSYSNDDDGYMDKRLDSASRTATAAGAMPPQAQQMRSRGSPTPLKSTAPTSAMIEEAIRNPTEANLKAAGLLNLPRQDYITIHINQTIPLRVLEAQKDQGHVLVLKEGNGITKVEFSNKDHDTEASRALGNVDLLCGEATALLHHNVEKTPLLMTANIPLTSDVTPADLGSTNDKETPHGKLSWVLDGNGTKEVVARGLTMEQLAFMNLFPGQTEHHVKKMAHSLDMDANLMLVKVGSPVHFYHNLDAEVIKQGKQIMRADERGYAYAEKAPTERAMKIAEEKAQSNLGHCCITNKGALRLVLSMPHQNTRVSEVHDSKLKQPNLFSSIKAKAMDALERAGKLTAKSQERINDTMLHIRGTVRIPYVRNVAPVKAAPLVKQKVAGTVAAPLNKRR